MNTSFTYVVRVDLNANPVYVVRCDKRKVATDLTPHLASARRFTYAVSLAVARRNGGHVVQIPVR